MTQQAFKTPALTIIALVAFAANSLLCRWALGQHDIDAASFATVRVVSGAATLCLILLARDRGAFPRLAPNWGTVAALCIYMLCFSLAYLSLSAGTGALILFGAVQLTMFIVALREGEHFSAMSWAGLAVAFAGLVYLVLPGLSAPDPAGAILMATAGVSWGAYSLLGRGAKDSLLATATNFSFSIPIVLVASLLSRASFHVAPVGVTLAVVSGALTSGCGYVVWYAALRGLSGTRAAVVQLAVPIIAALAGAAILAEHITPRLLAATVATIGGVALVLTQRSRQQESKA